MSFLTRTAPAMTAARAQALAAAIAAFPTLDDAWDGLVSASMEAGLVALPADPEGADAPVVPPGFVGNWDVFFASRA